MEVVVALLMFVNHEIKEHRIQPSMSMCLKGKREASRQFSFIIGPEVLRRPGIEVNIEECRNAPKPVKNG